MTEPNRPQLPASLKARVLADAPKAAPAEPLGLATLVVATCLWLAAFTFWHGRRDNWSALPPTASWIPLLAIFASAGLATGIGLSRGKWMLGAPTRYAMGALAVPIVGAVVVALLVPDVRPSPHAGFWRETLACDAGVGLVALPLVAIFLWRLRGRILASPALVGAVTGVAAATFGHALLHWGCPWTDGPHVLLGHIVPAIPLAALGALLAVYFSRRK